MTTNYTTVDGDMLDNLCFKHYGAIQGYINRVYEANPELAKHPVALPAGITITFPDVVISKEVNLW